MDALAALVPQHDPWPHAAYEVVSSPALLAGLVPWPSQSTSLLHVGSFPAPVYLGFLHKQSKAHMV